VGVLSTLRQDKAGEWGSLLDFLREARHRESRAVAALANTLTAPAAEQRELAEAIDAGPVLLELACDLRMPKTSRLAAARCLLEAGIEAPYNGQLFLGAGDLVTDPRLGGAARKLVEGGLPSAATSSGPAEAVSIEAGAFARGVAAAASTVGAERVKELLQGAPAFHAGVVAGLFAIGAGELPETQREQWKKILAETCAANKRAPAAARRLGLAPPWPPNLPEAFGPLVKEAEAKAAGVVSTDAVANPAALKKSPAIPEVAVRGGRPAPPPALPSPKLAEGKTLAPAIRRSPFRQMPTAPEPPTRVPAKPMEEVKARPRQQDPPPEPERPRIGPRISPNDELPARPAPVAMPPHKQADLRFDPGGNRISRADRWDDNHFQWQEPVLPAPVLPPPMKAAVAPGPFMQRVASIFEDRPEAVERLCAAAEAHVALRGDEQLLKELNQELARKKWLDKKAPLAQIMRLRAVAQDERQPGSWRSAARLLLERLG
jgi:hypothetical protein